MGRRKEGNSKMRSLGLFPIQIRGVTIIDESLSLLVYVKRILSSIQSSTLLLFFDTKFGAF